MFVIHLGRLTQEGSGIFPQVEILLRPGDRFLVSFDLHEVIDRLKPANAPPDLEVAKNLLVPAHSGNHLSQYAPSPGQQRFELSVRRPAAARIWLETLSFSLVLTLIEGGEAKLIRSPIHDLENGRNPFVFRRQGIEKCLRLVEASVALNDSIKSRALALEQVGFEIGLQARFVALTSGP